MAIITSRGALVQIGVTAMRNPDGSFLPPEPMYVLRPIESVKKSTGMTGGEENLLTDISGVFKSMADKRRQYAEAVGMEDDFPEEEGD